MTGRARITAWRPSLAGVREVFHARFTDHAYPAHTHDAWTLLVVDDGVVSYNLDRHEHGALRSLVTLLPPDIVHDGRSVLPQGFRKRVLYLDRGVLGDDLVGASVDRPGLPDRLLRQRVHQLHGVLASPGDELEAESRLALIAERLRRHLAGRPEAPERGADPGLAGRLRDLLDADVPGGLTLEQAARTLHAHRVHLVRVFTREYGIPPHRYLTGRRVDLARGYLLEGRPAAEAAVLAGFFDQSHLTRHFRRLVGTTPAQFAAGR